MTLYLIRIKTCMSNFHEIRVLIEKIRAAHDSTPEHEELYELVLASFPNPSKRGKSCPDCQFRMENRCRTCPNCQRAMLKRKRVQRVPVTIQLQAHECNICGKAVDEDLCELECGCKYHRGCLVYLASYSERCCEHKHIKIPDDYKT